MITSSLSRRRWAKTFGYVKTLVKSGCSVKLITDCLISRGIIARTKNSSVAAITLEGRVLKRYEEKARPVLTRSSRIRLRDCRIVFRFPKSGADAYDRRKLYNSIRLVLVIPNRLSPDAWDNPIWDPELVCLVFITKLRILLNRSLLEDSFMSVQPRRGHRVITYLD